MKKKDATDGTSEWASAPAGRITPLEVQQKAFQVARFGAGYRMREVDEFLDQVTDALTALLAENERLLRASGDREPAPSRPSVGQTAGDADRTAVEAFLQREKGFLRDLGGLVQEHAEELRSMVRAVRQDASAAATAAPPQETELYREPAPAPAPEAAEESEAPQDQTADDSDASGPTAPAMPPPDVLPDEGEGEGEGGDRKTLMGSATVITGAVADEPILLDEPEPARSGRPDEEEDGSLKELFWGEE